MVCLRSSGGLCGHESVRRKPRFSPSDNRDARPNERSGTAFILLWNRAAGSNRSVPPRAKTQSAKRCLPVTSVDFSEVGGGSECRQTTGVRRPATQHKRKARSYDAQLRVARLGSVDVVPFPLWMGPLGVFRGCPEVPHIFHKSTKQTMIVLVPDVEVLCYDWPEPERLKAPLGLPIGGQVQGFAR
jgi:hypothetical protein